MHLSSFWDWSRITTFGSFEIKSEGGPGVYDAQAAFNGPPPPYVEEPAPTVADDLYNSDVLLSDEPLIDTSVSPGFNSIIFGEVDLLPALAAASDSLPANSPDIVVEPVIPTDEPLSDINNDGSDADDGDSVPDDSGDDDSSGAVGFNDGDPAPEDPAPEDDGTPSVPTYPALPGFGDLWNPGATVGGRSTGYPVTLTGDVPEEWTNAPRTVADEPTDPPVDEGDLAATDSSFAHIWDDFF